MSMKIEGLDDLQKELKKLQNDVDRTKEKYDGQSVSFDDLFIEEFMGEHTKFTSFDDWFSAGHFHAASQEEFDAIPERTLDRYVRRSTDFETWQDMLDTAGGDLLQKELGWD